MIGVVIGIGLIMFLLFCVYVAIKIKGTESISHEIHKNREEDEDARKDIRRKRN